MTNKTFTIAGVSTLGRITKQRFANGSVADRTKVLARNGHTDIKLFELPTAMSKDEAKAFIEAKFAGATAPAAKDDKVAVAA
jgi:hypothetical protein